MRALVAAATALALTACGSTGSSDTSKSTSTASAASTSSSSEADTKNTISIPAGESVSQDSDVTAMVAVDFTTMDPMDTSDTLSGGVQRMMMDGLFGFDENMQIIPMLATSYEANDEATEYTIHLREGVSFTDGTPWNADALIANVNKWADKCACAVADWTKEPIAPGGKGVVKATFDAKALGHFEKSVGIYSNASPSLVYLKFTGEVVQEIKDYTKLLPHAIGNIRLDRDEFAFPDVYRGQQPSLTFEN